ncbi:MAG: FMN-binding glutamate synthase family protein, partial [Psychrobacter sp.]
MPESRTNLNPEPKTSSPYFIGLLLRYSTFGAAILILLAGLLLVSWWLIVIGGLAVALGIYDLIQSKHAILSNYP